MKINKPIDSDLGQLESLKKLSSLKYARPRNEVEEEIRKGYK